MTQEEKQAVVRDLNRRATAAMETGNPQVARTIVAELAEFDAQAAYGLRAAIIKDYNTDL